MPSFIPFNYFRHYGFSTLEFCGLITFLTLWLFGLVNFWPKDFYAFTVFGLTVFRPYEFSALCLSDLIFFRPLTFFFLTLQLYKPFGRYGSYFKPSIVLPMKLCYVKYNSIYDVLQFDGSCQVMTSQGNQYRHCLVKIQFTRSCLL